MCRPAGGGTAGDFLDSLRTFRFTGDIWAVPEGTPVFPGEPLVTVRAPAAQAQLIETYALLCINHQSLIATKAASVGHAAEEYVKVGDAVLHPPAEVAVGHGHFVEVEKHGEVYALLCINHQSLIATKANRVVRAAQGRTVLEFGSRRAQGEGGTVGVLYGHQLVYAAKYRFAAGGDKAFAYAEAVDFRSLEGRTRRHSRL